MTNINLKALSPVRMGNSYISLPSEGWKVLAYNRKYNTTTGVITLTPLSEVEKGDTDES